MAFLVYNQFVPDASHVDDAYVLILRKFVPQFGDEHMQAALVEERIVSPQVKQDAAHVHHLVKVDTQAAQDFTFPIGE